MKAPLKKNKEKSKNNISYLFSYLFCRVLKLPHRIMKPRLKKERKKEKTSISLLYIYLIILQDPQTTTQNNESTLKKKERKKKHRSHCYLFTYLFCKTFKLPHEIMKNPSNKKKRMKNISLLFNELFILQDPQMTTIIKAHLKRK